MLKLFSEEYPVLNMDRIREVFLLTTIITRRPVLSLLCFKNIKEDNYDDITVVNNGNMLYTDMMGYSYLKSNGFILRSIVQEKPIARVILGETKILHRRLFEAIEYMDGQIEVSIFSNFIALVKAPAEQIKAEYYKKLAILKQKSVP